mmetsp:Transcript_22443/g.39549  ORF Transcript_22443/g.39549 Transcript_22443/m.39549 type:complete len:172 (+) Transcript_22443:88-603(+)
MRNMAMMATIDSQGRCLHHPFVQLQRLSHRTGEWKALLDSCPLCVMDDKSVCSASVCSSAIAVEDNPLVVPSSSSSERGRGRGRAASPSFENALVSLAPAPRRRSSSRVSFHGLERQSSSTSLPAHPTSDQSLSGLSYVDGIISVAGSSSVSSSGSVAQQQQQQQHHFIIK